MPVRAAGTSNSSDHLKNPGNISRRGRAIVASRARSHTRPDAASSKVVSPLLEKLELIVVPEVNFTNLEFNRVVAALGALAEEFDPASSGPKGANLVLLDPENTNPTVTITLRDLSLKRILDFVTGLHRLPI